MADGIDPHQGNPPSGWYPDPQNPGMLRFWSGTEWTEHRSPEHARMSGTPWRSFSEWFSRCFTVAWKQITNALFISLLFSIPSLALAFGAFFWAFEPVRIDSNCNVSGFQTSRLVMLGIALLVSAILQAMGQLGVNRQMQLGWMDRSESWSASVARSIHRLPQLVGAFLAVLGVSLAAMGVIVVLSVFVHPSFLLLLLVAIPALIWAYVVFEFLPVTAVAAPAGTPLIKTTIAVTKDRWWSAFGRFIALGIVLSLLSGALSAIVSVIMPGNGIEGAFAEFSIDESGSYATCTPTVFAEEFGSTPSLVINAIFSAVIYGLVALPYAAGLAGFYLDSGAPTDPSPAGSPQDT